MNNHRKFLKSWYKRNTKRHSDNHVRRYDAPTPLRENLEEALRNAIRKERDNWRKPYDVKEVYKEGWFIDPNYISSFETVRYTPKDKTTIRQLLAENDAKYRSTTLANWCGHIRVPSLKRSDREWLAFYRTFPRLAVEVAVGKERFCDGAKLKYIPLFRRILDEEWPEELPMWTEEQYDLLKQQGMTN